MNSFIKFKCYFIKRSCAVESPLMKLYDFLLSGNCYKVRLLLTQIGIPFERVTIQPGHIPITQK